MSDIDVNRVVISKEVVYGTKNSLKYFIGYFEEDDVITPSLLKLPCMIGCLKEFNDSIYYVSSLKIYGCHKLFSHHLKEHNQ